MSRANSLKKAVREIIEHTEKALDDQNEQTATRHSPPIITLDPSEDTGGQLRQKTGQVWLMWSCQVLKVE